MEPHCSSGGSRENCHRISEFRDYDSKWAATEKELEALTEEYTQAALQSAFYPFYGCYQLPSWIRSMEIAEGVAGG